MKTLIKTMAFVALAGLSFSTRGQEDIVDRLDKALGVTLPDGYRQKVKDFAANDTIMRTRSATQYTEEFIKQEMKADWGISKQNQLLFMWSKIYHGISQKKLYDWLDDENKERRNDYKKCLRTISDFYKRYKTGFKAYMEAGIAEADRRYNEADRRYNEADRRIAEADRRTSISLYSSLGNLTWFYYRYKRDPSTIKNEEVKWWKEDGIRIIQWCNKDMNIDYLSLLPTEVLEFYGIHPVGNQRNTLTCEQARVQLLTLTLKEVVKLYNIYQQVPKAEREIYDIKDVIKNCKEFNIDYRAILLEELGNKKKVDDLLKFYGIE